MARRPTDEEAWALEKTWTENPPELADESPMEGTGHLTRRKELLQFLDDTSTNYILTIAEHDHLQMEIKEFHEELQDPFSDDFPLDNYPTVYPENLSEKGKILFDMMSLFTKYSGELSKLLGESTVKQLSSFFNGVINEIKPESVYVLL